MSQKQNCMYVGFDTAKAKLDWSLIDLQGIEQTYGTVPNDAAELMTLLLRNDSRALQHLKPAVLHCKDY